MILLIILSAVCIPFPTLLSKKKKEHLFTRKFVGGQAYLVNASGFVLIYSVTDRSSFEALTGLKYVTPLHNTPHHTTHTHTHTHITYTFLLSEMRCCG